MNGSHGSKLEFVQSPRRDGDYMRCQIAIGHRLVPSMDIPIPVWYEFSTEEALFAYLVRQGQGLLDQFGDARAERRTDC